MRRVKVNINNKKQNWESLIFIYDTTLRKSLSFDILLGKVDQLGWFSTSTKYFPFSLNKLRIEQINDHNSSWIKIILKSLCVSKIVLVSKLFLQMFCKKNYICKNHA